MTKYALISDLHFETRISRHIASANDPGAVDLTKLQNYIEAFMSATFDPFKPVDVVLVAGDIHANIWITGMIYQYMRNWAHMRLRGSDGQPTELHAVLGNHDYYGMSLKGSAGSPSTFWDCEVPKSLIGIDGSIPDFAIIPDVVIDDKIAKATLWTDTSRSGNETIKYGYSNMLDAVRIKGWSPERLTDRHRYELDVIGRSDAEIVMTHHAPTKTSISPRWSGHPLNDFFVNSLELNGFTSMPRVWVHGHVHSRHDYLWPVTPPGQKGSISFIRVLCNPLGYPGEIYPSDEYYRPVYFSD